MSIGSENHRRCLRGQVDESEGLEEIIDSKTATARQDPHRNEEAGRRSHRQKRQEKGPLVCTSTEKIGDDPQVRHVPDLQANRAGCNQSRPIEE